MYSIIIGFHTCSKNISRYVKLKNLVLNEFKKYKNIKVYFVFSNSNKDYIDNENMFLKGPETYEYLPVKTINFLKYIDKELNYTHILKMDDDIFIDVDKFVTFLKTILKYDYVGFFHEKKALKDVPRKYHINKCSNDSFNEIIYEPYDYDFCNGACYMLSKKAVKFILKNYKNNFEYERCLINKKGSEDRMIGQILTSKPKLKGLKMIANGWWVDKVRNIFATFNDSVIHPILLENFPKITNLKKKFIFSFILK
jgi:hypothetical protein